MDQVMDRASDATNSKGNSPMLRGASHQSTIMSRVPVKPKIDGSSSPRAPEYKRCASDILQESTYQRFDNCDDKQTKKSTGSLASHSSLSKKSTIQSLQNLHSILYQ